MRGHKHPPLHRSLALSLALCAMLLRAVLPAGWMPNPSAEAGASPFVICSVNGTHSGGKPFGDTTQERTHAPCAFAAAAPLSPPALAAVRLAAPGAYRAIARPTVSIVVARTVLRHSHAPRAPPIFS